MKTSVDLIRTAIACFPLIAMAQTAPAPELKPGDTWTYHLMDGYTKAETDVYSQTVREVTPDGYMLAWESKKSGRQAVRTYTKDWNPVIRGEGMIHSPYYPYLKFPLTVGKTWAEDSTYKQTTDGGKWQYSTQGKVVGFGKVTVPAGEFDAYEISSNATYTGQRPGVVGWSGWRKETLWYAPAARAVIKFQYEESLVKSKAPNRFNTELQSYSLQ